MKRALVINSDRSANERLLQANVVRACTDQQMESCHTNGPPVRAAAIWLLRQDFRRNTACRPHQRTTA